MVADARWAKFTRRLCRLFHTTVGQTSVDAGRTPSDTVSPSTTVSSEFPPGQTTTAARPGRAEVPAGRYIRTPGICLSTVVFFDVHNASAAGRRTSSTSTYRPRWSTVTDRLKETIRRRVRNSTMYELNWTQLYTVIMLIASKYIGVARM